MKKLSILIPCFNEKKLVKKSIIQAIKLKNFKKDIIIIDNGSTDGTQKILKKFLGKKNIRIILRKKNLGYGMSVKEGLKYSKYKYMYIHFSDCEYDIKTTFKMYHLAEKKKLDAVFGSRFKGYTLKKKLKSLKNKPAYLGTLIITSLYNILYNKKFSDVIGSKFYKVSSIRDIKIKHNYFRYDFALKNILIGSNYSIDEVFTKYKPRKVNSDKNVKFYHIFPAIYEILKNKLLNN
jgi:glycosyltransferase involved in cell wall biosynthesis